MTRPIDSYRDAADAVVSIKQSGSREGRRVGRTHLDRSVAELRAAGLDAHADELIAEADKHEREMRAWEDVMRAEREGAEG
jgi:hypothetical protein